ncbi:TonB-dependent receptor [Sphingobium sp. EM0848]|uniref:TonB-dependent receptor n=1 Tax=Sphingobium sp. EM0848 TaxID=2743473 RepID=UPI00159C4F87|nr:TonB-dependent receptor [Sphingobium sp. EM0848]
MMAPPAGAEEREAAHIVVTARRLEERSEDVPLAVDVIPAQNIGSGGVDGLQMLANHVPGLSFEAIWGGANSFPALRGQQQPSAAGDNVGMFVDGVYQANRDATDIEPLDLERIEVVRGPQSAMFGHSSFAGLIHYVPAQPTEALMMKGTAEVGTDGLQGVRGVISGPLNALFKMRLAASVRAADGTVENGARPGQPLGSWRRFAMAASIATRDDTGPLSAQLAMRYAMARSNQPPFFTLDYHDFNCGSRDPASGVWSYFCGRAPVTGPVALSPDIPDSRTRTGQIALHLALDAGEVELRSDSSYYRSRSDSFRDFDGSADGETYGVCLVGVNCTGIGSLTIPVVRLQQVNIVQRRSLSAREISQELRLIGSGERRLGWQVGAEIFWTSGRLQTQPPARVAYGAETGGLAANERFSSLVLSNPQRVGAPAAINSALVDNPDTLQLVQNDSVERRRTIALFATADYHLSEPLRLRAEVRISWERVRIDSRIANFGTSSGTGAEARNFHYVTPRIGVDYRPKEGWLAFLSYARGARSGGINAVPNLLPSERTFEPETNWTAEMGVKYAGTGFIQSLRTTVYDINWHNSQILGLSSSPGVNTLIQRNTTGIHTQGVEIDAELAPAPWLRWDVAYSFTNPRFKAGSEDPGSSAFCGLSLGVTTSSFCSLRPSLINSGQLVPDISGNRVFRAARTSWTSGLALSPAFGRRYGLRLRLSASHQGNVYERAINGLYYGERTLVDGGISCSFGAVSVELWGTNLGNDHYIRVAAGRPPTFYLGIPRPIDLIVGEGRRIGLTLRLSH